MAMSRITRLALATLLGGCYVPIHRTHGTPLPIALTELARDTLVTDTLRVTRTDGREVHFVTPVTIGVDGIAGRGRVRGQRAPAWFTPADSIAEVTVVRRELRLWPTVLATAAVSTATAIAIMQAFFSLWT